MELLPQGVFAILSMVQLTNESLGFFGEQPIVINVDRSALAERSADLFENGPPASGLSLKIRQFLFDG